ncbi:XRE family transcriptional regulator [Turicimonas muris]|uniref:XRE family transcriptional regulator n=2 Tax=Turicimonas muris TaxID=1796652 RepID=UPI0025A5A39C|nr:LexA family transcriptional regulator [Turicimonas muris]
MGIGKNVKLIRELRGLTQIELSERTGGVASQAAISALEKRDSSRTQYLNVLAKALNVSTSLLLKADLKPSEVEGEGIEAWEEEDKEIDDAFVEIPEFELCVSAGCGFSNGTDADIYREIEQAPKVRYRLDFFTSRGINSSYCKRFKVDGDSMEPLLFDGDRILVNTADSLRIKDGAVYAINYNGELKVKRLQRKMNGSILLMSENKAYPPEEISSDAIEEGRFFIIGKVLEKSSTYGFD